MDARRLACEVLFEVERSGAFADALLGRSLARYRLPPVERRLATLLVYGTLARRSTLDHTLSAYASRPLRKLEHRVLEILRMGLFQIAFLDRVPAYAAVDASVRLARTYAPAASGLINAILRRAADHGLVPLPEPGGIERIAIEFSHPEWLVATWLDELGHDEAVALMAADNEPMPNVLRALESRSEAIMHLRESGHDARAAALAPDAIVADAPVCEPSVCVPQSEGSQLVALFASVTRGERVLDACAAPGGKTAYLAKMVGASGMVVAVDPGRDARRKILAALDSARCRDMANVEVLGASITEAAPGDGFDCVLVDAPCSGLGTLREHPEIRWRRCPQDVEDLAQRQSVILRAAAEHVRPGGRLVYATCTLLRAENDDVVDAFLAESSRFAEETPTLTRSEVRSVCGPDGRLRTFPHLHDTGGFFAARLRRH